MCSWGRRIIGCLESREYLLSTREAMKSLLELGMGRLEVDFMPLR
jgi:hypothetical protein